MSASISTTVPDSWLGQVPKINSGAIHLHASSVAAFTGNHAYQDLIEAWMRVWKSIDNKNHYDQMLQHCKNTNPCQDPLLPVDAIEGLITEYGVNDEVKKQVDQVEAKAMQCQDAADVQRQIRHTKQALFTTLVQSEHTTSKIKKELSCVETIIHDKRKQEANQQCQHILVQLQSSQNSRVCVEEAQKQVRQFGSMTGCSELQKEWVDLATGTKPMNKASLVQFEQKLHQEMEKKAMKRAEQDITRIEKETQKLATEPKPTQKKTVEAERNLKRLLEDSSVPPSYAKNAMHAAKKVRTEAQDAAETISAVPTQTISCTFGERQEENSLEHLEKLWNTTIVKDNKYRSISLPGIGKSKTWCLGGRVDGVTADGTLVEIKNRRSRIFDDIPFYEKVQLECYMRIFNASKIYLVQHLRRKNSGLKQKISLVKRDDFFWEQNIIALLSRASVSFENMLQNPKRCQSLLRASQKDPRKRDDLFIREWWGMDTIFKSNQLKK